MKKWGALSLPFQKRFVRFAVVTIMVLSASWLEPLQKLRGKTVFQVQVNKLSRQRLAAFNPLPAHNTNMFFCSSLSITFHKGQASSAYWWPPKQLANSVIEQQFGQQKTLISCSPLTLNLKFPWGACCLRCRTAIKPARASGPHRPVPHNWPSWFWICRMIHFGAQIGKRWQNIDPR